MTNELGNMSIYSSNNDYPTNSYSASTGSDHSYSYDTSSQGGYTSYSQAEDGYSTWTTATALSETASGQSDMSSQYAEGPYQAADTNSYQGRQAYGYTYTPAENNRQGLTCRVHGCLNTTPFGRQADLDRHHQSVHARRSERPSFPCDYPRCDRNAKPFSRKDHYREHLREYHAEDLPRRVGRTMRDGRVRARVTPAWFRCASCLQRVVIATDGFVCPGCNTSCGPEQMSARQAAFTTEE